MFNSIIAVILMFFNLYATKCDVVQSDNEVVSVMTCSGEVFEFYGEGYQKGDRVNVLFNSNGTETIFDDRIEFAGRAV